MSAFKVGDRVRVNEVIFEYDQEYVGREGEVTQVDSHPSILGLFFNTVHLGDERAIFFSDELELIES